MTDVAMAAFHRQTPALRRVLQASARDADVVIASHPYGMPLMLDADLGRPLVYEAHNVEFDLKQQMLADQDGDALSVVEDCERRSCEVASMVVACSESDGRRLHELFHFEPRLLVEVPNGCDRTAITFVGNDVRTRSRLSVGLEDYTMLFVGSWHEPNLEAGRAVVAAARRLPEIHVVLVGGAGQALAGEDELPANVDVTGPVSAGFLRDVLGLANVAVNPMRLGSGTNLKMLDYALAGIPVISSLFGARGLGFQPGVHYAHAEPNELAAALQYLKYEDEIAISQRVSLAFDRVVSTFDWPVIARKWLSHPIMSALLRTG